jgi:hypothetical protein
VASELEFNRDAYFAQAALLDPPSETGYGWVDLHTVESCRGHPVGSDGADYLSGLDQLVAAGWAEQDGEHDRWRLTSLGRRKR